MDNRERFIEFYINAYNVQDDDYWLIEYFADRLELSKDQVIYLALLESITYSFAASLCIFFNYPDFYAIDFDEMQEWWNVNQSRVPYQMDKMKQRRFLCVTLKSMRDLFNGHKLSTFFDKFFIHDPYENFDNLWSLVSGSKSANEIIKSNELNNERVAIKYHGRFSNWNLAEFLSFMCEYDLVPPSLFLGEDGSESITNGCCYVCDKLDWVTKKEMVPNAEGKLEKVKIYHKFTKEEKDYLETFNHDLMESIKARGYPCNNFDLESNYCAFKKMFRENDSRYVGYYLDRQAEDIQKAESMWPELPCWKILWEGRDLLIPEGFNHKKIDTSKYTLSVDEKCGIKGL